MARGNAEKRRTRKNKMKERKKHPYRRGGGKRTMALSKKTEPEKSKKSKTKKSEKSKKSKKRKRSK